MTILSPNRIYSWRITTADGRVVDQYGPDGRERTWKDIPADQVALVELIPAIQLLPEHRLRIDIAGGERFVRRFGRGKLRMAGDGIRLREYVNCIVTTRLRMWVYHNGRVVVTGPDVDSGG